MTDQTQTDGHRESERKDSAKTRKTQGDSQCSQKEIKKRDIFAASCSEKEIFMKIAIITGASSGMGYETSLQLDRILQKTDEIWLVARNKEKMLALKNRLRNNVRIIPMDLTDENCFSTFAQILNIAKPQIRFLINCAGFGYMGDVEDIPTEELADMINCNCVGLTRMTSLCIPYLCKNARIIQFASSAAFIPQPGFAVYAASKSYVLSFSKALSEELRKKQIYVTSVCPGPVATEFFDKAEIYGKTLSIKKYVMETPERVVAKALRDSYCKKKVSVCGFPMKAFYLLTNVIPEDLILMVLRLLYR